MKSDIGLLYYLNTFKVLLMYKRSIYNPGESTTKLSFNFIFILQDFLVVLLLQLVLPCTFHRASTNIAQAKREQQHSTYKMQKCDSQYYSAKL